jgi:hypothetical protein
VCSEGACQNIFIFFFLIPADSAIYLPFLWRAEINRYTMSQHLIKEVQQLKHEVRMLKEGPEHRDMGVNVDDLMTQVEKNRIALVKIAEMLEDVIDKVELLRAEVYSKR